MSRPPVTEVEASSSSSDTPPSSLTPSATAATTLPLVIVGACFHELKARVLATVDGAADATSAFSQGTLHEEKHGRHTKARGTAPVERNVTHEQAEGGGGSGSEKIAAQAKMTNSNSSGSLLSSLPWLLRLVNRPEGFLVEAEGVVVRAEHDKELGKRLDSLGRQVRGLVAAHAGLPGRFVGWLVDVLVGWLDDPRFFGNSGTIIKVSPSPILSPLFFGGGVN